MPDTTVHHPSESLTLSIFVIIEVSTHIHSSGLTYLICHDHGRAPMNAQDGYKCLRGNKIQNLGNGFLVSAIPKNHPVDLSPRHQVAHVGDDAFWVGLVDQQCDHVDIDGVLLAPQSPDVPVWDVPRASQDHSNVQHRHLFRAGSLLSRHRVTRPGQHHQEGQWEERSTITSTVAPSPLAPYAAEEHAAKPLHPLDGKSDKKNRWWQSAKWRRHKKCETLKCSSPHAETTSVCPNLFLRSLLNT